MKRGEYWEIKGNWDLKGVRALKMIGGDITKSNRVREEINRIKIFKSLWKSQLG